MAVNVLEINFSKYMTLLSLLSYSKFAIQERFKLVCIDKERTASIIRIFCLVYFNKLQNNFATQFWQDQVIFTL